MKNANTTCRPFQDKVPVPLGLGLQVLHGVSEVRAAQVGLQIYCFRMSAFKLADIRVSTGLFPSNGELIERIHLAFIEDVLKRFALARADIKPTLRTQVYSSY